MQITLERQSKTIALSFNTDNSIAYDELYLAVQDKMSGIVNGGKFFAGVVGKAFTIVGNAVSVLSKNIYVQGLTVAAAGGLGSRLAGGSFELGFLTAGLAFATNEVLTGLEQKRIESARELGIKRIGKLRSVVSNAVAGKRGAIRRITKYFGADAASNLSALDANLANISAELSTAIITAGNSAYIARRLAQGDIVGAWVHQSVHPDTIFYNPSLTSDRIYFSALLVHEASHLAGFGHEYFQNAVAYGGAAVRGLAGSERWSVTSNNASSYTCAAYTRAIDC